MRDLRCTHQETHGRFLWFCNRALNHIGMHHMRAIRVNDNEREHVS